LRLDVARLRFWSVVLPVHLAAFGMLYFGTLGLLEYSYSHAGAAAARRQLDQAVRELPFVMPIGSGQRTQLLSHLLVAYQPIGLHLYGHDGVLIGSASGSPDRDEMERVRNLLGDSHRPDEVWVQAQNGRQWVRGIVRLTAENACLHCHQAGTTLGAATMKIDLSDELIEIRALLHKRIGLLLGCWILLVGAGAFLVQQTARRSLSRLEADLDAAAAGKSHANTAHELSLDPATAALHGRLHKFLRRQRKREEEVASRLAHVDQLASLGQLSAGLAHEIKNPLAGIQGALEVLKGETSDPSTAGVYDEMLRELKRVNGILQRLLDSGRPAPLRLTDTDLSRLVAETVELLQPALRRKKIELSAEVASDLPQAQLDGSKIRQVLVNLVQNAAEEMDESGGHVIVRASALPERGGVILAVEDDGPGIAAENRDRIFEPFFTTKFSGTGLGLAISKGLIEQHGGSIEVDSEIGRGTTFFVFLPTGEPSAAPAATEEVA
jgi:signal transduction histidine kinase